MRRASGLLRLVLLAFGLLLAGACSAQNESPAAAGNAGGGAAGAGPTAASVASMHFTEGQQYVRLQPPADQPAPTGPVVIVEAFSYACPHCAEFAPYMDQLKAALPRGVEVRSMPVVFNAEWMAAAQAYYAARELGVLAKTHDAVFKARREHYPLNSLQDYASFYARHGVDPEKFLAAATSDATMRQMRADQHTEIGWGIDSTPTLVVGRLASDRKDAPFIALMRSADFGDYETLQKLGLWMVDQVRAH